jgi:hypothetical protein
MGTTAALRNGSGRTSEKADLWNFVELGFSEVQLPTTLRYQGLCALS